MINQMSIKNLTFFFDPRQIIFNEANCDLPLQENVHIEGQSGSGRSAFLKLLSGLLRAQRGQYLVNGENVQEMSFEEFLPTRRRMGYCFDLGGLLANRTLWDNMMLPLQYHSECTFEEAVERVSQLMRQFRVYEARERRPASVSGSVRKATILARSFVMRPEILFMDDPFVGLDQEVIEALFERLETEKKENRLRHIFFTSRGEKIAQKLATSRLEIREGKIFPVGKD